MTPPELVHTPIVECEDISNPREPNYLLLTLGVVLGAMTVGALLWISPLFLPTEDPDRLVFGLIQRATDFIPGVICVVLGLFLIDRCTPGRWLRRILNDTRAIAGVVMVVIYCLFQLYRG